MYKELTGGGVKEDKLRLRYQKMLDIMVHINIPKGRVSILDVGCGYGGLCQYGIEKGYAFDYTGIDVCENMIQYARKHNESGEFICGDILEYCTKKKYDFVICNGILTQKLETSIRAMDEYARMLVKKMWDLSIRGIAFNIMKSQVDFMNEKLYYKSPLEMISYGMMLTDKFVIDSAYPLYEYSVYLYK